MSRRILYFAGDQLFFHCRRAIAARLVRNDPYPSARYLTVYDGEGYRDAILLQSPLVDYAWMVQHYTKRALTKETDILRALSGIMRRVSDKLEYLIITRPTRWGF